MRMSDQIGYIEWALLNAAAKVPAEAKKVGATPRSADECKVLAKAVLKHLDDLGYTVVQKSSIEKSGTGAATPSKVDAIPLTMSAFKRSA